MTVAAISTQTVYALAGAALGPFNTVWPYAKASDVTVQVDYGAGGGPELLAQGADYVLTANNPTLSNGGQVTLAAYILSDFGAAWGPDAEIILQRVTPRSQPSAFGEAVGFSPQATEQAIDNVERQVQELTSSMGRALLVGYGETAPAIPSTPSTLWGLDGGGDFLPFVYGASPNKLIGIGPAGTLAFFDPGDGDGATPPARLGRVFVDDYIPAGFVDGVADYGPYIMAAYHALGAQGGGVLKFGSRSYRCSPQNFSAYNTICLEGTALGDVPGLGTTIIANGLADTLWTFGVFSGLTIRDMMFTSTGQQIGGAYLDFEGTVITACQRLTLTKGWNGIVCGPQSNIQTFEFVGIYDWNNSAVTINTIEGDQHFRDCFGNCVNNALTPVDFFHVVQSGGVLIIDSCDIIHAHIGLNIIPGNGQIVQWFYVSKTAFDSADWNTARGGIGINIAPTGNGIVTGGWFDSFWTATANVGVVINGLATTTIENLSFRNHYCINNLLWGAKLAYVNGVYWDSPMIDGNSTQAAGASSGIYLDAGATNIQLVNGSIGKATSGFNTLQKNCIETSAAFAGRITATNVDMSRSSGPAFLNAGAPAAGSGFVNCPGVNYTGVVNVPVTTSPTLITAGAAPEFISVALGTVTQIIAGGRTLFTVTNVGFMLAPFEQASIAWTSAPTIGATVL